MMICRYRFNTYLAAAFVALTLCGCSSDGDKQSKKLLTRLRFHVEATRDSTKAQESVPIFREKPVWVTISKQPFLSEAQVSSAAVVDVVGGFALRIQLDHAGTTLLEEVSTANRGRRMAIFCQWGEEIKDFRWLAAPVMNRSITDGVLTFTPDANREEADEIATGLNNVSKKLHGWLDR